MTNDYQNWVWNTYTIRTDPPAPVDSYYIASDGTFYEAIRDSPAGRLIFTVKEAAPQEPERAAPTKAKPGLHGAGRFMLELD